MPGLEGLSELSLYRYASSSRIELFSFLLEANESLLCR